MELEAVLDNFQVNTQDNIQVVKSLLVQETEKHLVDMDLEVLVVLVLEVQELDNILV